MRWAAVEGYEGIYRVSDTGIVESLPRECLHCNGRIQRLRGRVMKQQNVDGYRVVNLCKENKATLTYVHQLVAKAFLPKPVLARFEVNHLDGVKSNNGYSNLEWCTPTENIQHACRTGLRDDVGAANNNSALDEAAVRSIHAAYAAGASPTVLAREHGVQKSAIYKIVNGRTWKHLDLPVIYRA